MASERKSRQSHQSAASETLPIREIASNIWIPFFSDFTGRHQGQRVDLEVQDAEAARPRLEIRHRPLQSISSMLGRPGEPDSLSVVVSDEDMRFQVRGVSDVAHVRLYQNGGEVEKLEIEARDSSRLFIVFRR